MLTIGPCPGPATLGKLESGHRQQTMPSQRAASEIDRPIAGEEDMPNSRDRDVQCNLCNNVIMEPQ